jgi:predicted ferric reductase
MAVVKKYLTEVVNIENKVEGIYTLELKSHSGPFKYMPGQFLHLALDEFDPSIGWPESRCFSMRSSPREEHIRITYAIKGAFTTRMSKEIILGTKVTLKLPYGDLFTQDHCKENTTFIAGGTGITPFLSLFTHQFFSNYRKPKLYAGFRNIGMNFYLLEFEKACQINPEFKLKVIYQDTDGILNIEKIYQEEKKACSSFFISGPPGMINYFRTFLLGQGISGSQVKTDEWE